MTDQPRQPMPTQNNRQTTKHRLKTHHVYLVLFCILIFATGTTFIAALLSIWDITIWPAMTSALTDEVVKVTPWLLFSFFFILLVMQIQFWPVQHIKSTEYEFRIKMADVKQTFRLLFKSDLQHIFTAHEEIDALEERFQHVLQHPNLHGVSNDVLQIAAKMSTATKDLAAACSDEKFQQLQAIINEARLHIAQVVEETERIEQLEAELSRDVLYTMTRHEELQARVNRLAIGAQELQQKVAALPLPGPDQPGTNVVPIESPSDQDNPRT